MRSSYAEPGLEISLRCIYLSTLFFLLTMANIFLSNFKRDREKEIIAKAHRDTNAQLPHSFTHRERILRNFGDNSKKSQIRDCNTQSTLKACLALLLDPLRASRIKRVIALFSGYALNTLRKHALAFAVLMAPSRVVRLRYSKILDTRASSPASVQRAEKERTLLSRRSRGSI